MDVFHTKKGATDYQVNVFCVEDALSANPGNPKTGLVFNSAGARVAWSKPGTVATAETLITQTVTGAHADWGFVEIDLVKKPGRYRLDLSDVVVNADADVSEVELGFTNVFCGGARIFTPTNTAKDIFDPITSSIFGLAQLEKMLVSVQGSISDVAPAAGDFDTDLTQADAFWNGRAFMFIDGALKGQITLLKETGGYVNASGHMEFDPAFTATPADGDNFIILAQSIDVNALRWLGTLLATPTVGGVPEVDMTHIKGGLVPVPTTTGILDINVERWLDTLVTLGSGAPDVNIQTSDNIALTAQQKLDVNAEADTALSDQSVTSVRLLKLDNLPEGYKKNTASSDFTFLMRDTNGNPKTGLTVAATRRIDSGAFAATANSVSEVSNGYYTIDFAASDLNGDKITFRFTASGAKDTGLTLKTNV